MSVPVMKIGIVGMPMDQRRVAVPMRMWFAGWHVRLMIMVVMFVVPVPVLVRQRLMGVIVIVPLGKMQP